MGFAGYGICWGCGKKQFLNHFGYCKECWEKSDFYLKEMEVKMKNGTNKRRT